jgi:hypothetical protein
MSVPPLKADIRQRIEHVCFVPLADIGRRHEKGNQDSVLVFRIIFFAIPSATICSERGMNGLLL